MRRTNIQKVLAIILMCSFISYSLENNEKVLVVDKLSYALNYVRVDLNPSEFDVLEIVHK